MDSNTGYRPHHIPVCRKQDLVTCGVTKEMEKLLGDVNRNGTSGRTARPKIERLHAVADKPVVVFDARVIRDVAKGFTLEFLIYITTECKQDDF